MTYPAGVAAAQRVLVAALAWRAGQRDATDPQRRIKLTINLIEAVDAWIADGYHPQGQMPDIDQG